MTGKRVMHVFDVYESSWQMAQTKQTERRSNGRECGMRQLPHFY